MDYTVFCKKSEGTMMTVDPAKKVLPNSWDQFTKFRGLAQTNRQNSAACLSRVTGAICCSNINDWLATICKMVRPMLGNRCLSVCMSLCDVGQGVLC